MNPSFVSSITPPTELATLAYWFLFRGHHLLAYDEGEWARIPRLMDGTALGMPILRQQYLGYLPDDEPIHCFTGEVAADVEPPPGMLFKGLRSYYGRLSEEMFWLGGRAVQIASWDRTHQFCGQCGSPTENHPQERSKLCPQCGLTTYPRISPAIIVAVTRTGENGRRELLLARGPNHRTGFYSVLAGFVEPGETLETCVAREVKEEVGLDVKNIRYFGQPTPGPSPTLLCWASPPNMLVAILCCKKRKLKRQVGIRPIILPHVPPSLSISRQLIDDFIAKNLPD